MSSLLGFCGCGWVVYKPNLVISIFKLINRIPRTLEIVKAKGIGGLLRGILEDEL